MTIEERPVSERIVDAPLADGHPLNCVGGCRRTFAWGSVGACTMWPKGCQTTVGDPVPEVCWEDCTDQQRRELSEAGCPTAGILLDKMGCGPDTGPQ